MEQKQAQMYDPSIPPVTPFLVGREAELVHLKERLRGSGNAALTALNGLPGVGKTALSITLAHDPEIRAYFRDGILWAGLGPEPNVQGHLSRWGMLLGMPSSEMSTLNDTVAWAVALRRAIGLRSMLLVIDDAWTLEEALIFKVGGPNCVHLVSTRFPSIAAQVAAEGAMAIKELNNEEGMQLLRTLAPQVVEQESQRARDLVVAVGGLPLALNLIGNYLRMQSYVSQDQHIASVLRRLSDTSERFNVSEPRGAVGQYPSLPNGTPVSLHTVIALTDQQLDAQTSQALHALSVFLPRPNSFSEEAALAVSECTVDTLDRLLDSGLLELSGSDRYSLHQTIADYSHLQLIASSTNAYECLVTYIMDFVEAHRKDYEMLEVESNNILATLETTYEQKRPGELMRIACAFAPFLLSRGLYQAAESHLQRAYHAAQSLSDHRSLASTLLYLGDIARKQGHNEQAEKYLLEGISYAREVNDEENICAILTILGTVRWKSGDYKQAEAYLQEGLDLARKLGNAESTGRLFEILGSVAIRLGDYVQAETYLQQGLDLARKVGEKELICTILLNLGTMTGEQARYVQSEAYLQEGLFFARQLNHSGWISALLNNLGDIAIELANYAQAEEYFQEGLELARQLGHREWISLLLLNLGITARKQSRYEQAKKCFQEGLVVARQIDIPQITSYCLYEYGNLHLDQRHVELAQTSFQEIISILPDHDYLIALAHYGLARVAHLNGSFQEARRLGEMSVAALESIGNRNALEVKKWLEYIES